MRSLGLLTSFALLACTADSADLNVFRGLSEPAQIRRDDFGVVHRLQMDQLRRRAYGRRAEVLPDRSADDAFIRHFDIILFNNPNQIEFDLLATLLESLAEGEYVMLPSNEKRPSFARPSPHREPRLS